MSTHNQETTPDQLLEAFRGRSLKSIIIFTLIVHVIIVGGTSVPYFIKVISGKTDSTLSEEERADKATREATTAIREIASKYGIKPQDLSTKMAGGAPKAPKEETQPAEENKTPEEVQPGGTTPGTGEQPGDGEPPKSEIEKELEVTKEGPTVPPIPVEEATDEDLFK